MTGDGVRPVLFASEYYPPFAPGGAEWTNAEWAKAKPYLEAFTVIASGGELDDDELKSRSVAGLK